jgi:hypothetical protein
LKELRLWWNPANGRQVMMIGLLDAVLAAHGRLGRWREFSTIEPTTLRRPVSANARILQLAHP